MQVLSTILTIILVLVCIAMIIVVMMQDSKNNGLGTLAGAAGENSYVSRNSARTPEGRLARLTKILGAAFIVLALVLDILSK